MKECSVTAIVTKEQTAAYMGSGDLEVLATPCMAALMEHAAMKCAADHLEEGMTTVGTALSITHDKASPVGACIRATARLIEQKGRAFSFEVEAEENGVLIGKGTHTRFAVDRGRFMAKLS